METSADPNLFSGEERFQLFVHEHRERNTELQTSLTFNVFAFRVDAANGRCTLSSIMIKHCTGVCVYNQFCYDV